MKLVQLVLSLLKVCINLNKNCLLNYLLLDRRNIKSPTVLSPCATRISTPVPSGSPLPSLDSSYSREYKDTRSSTYSSVKRADSSSSNYVSSYHKDSYSSAYKSSNVSHHYSSYSSSNKISSKNDYVSSTLTGASSKLSSSAQPPISNDTKSGSKKFARPPLTSQRSRTSELTSEIFI